MKSIKIKSLSFFSLWKLLMMTTIIPLCLGILFILFVFVNSLLDSYNPADKLGFFGAVGSIMIMILAVPATIFIQAVICAGLVKLGLWFYGKFFSAIEIEYDDGTPDLDNKEERELV